MFINLLLRLSLNKPEHFALIMIKGLAITTKGAEETAAAEIKELINAKSSVKEGAVVFEAKNLEDFCLLCYKAQSVSRVLVLLAQFEFDDLLEELEDVTKKLPLKEWLEPGKTFSVHCQREGEHGFHSVDVGARFGEVIFETFGNKANLKSPDIPFFAYVNGNMCYFGADVAGFDLSKREYKVFNNPVSIKGTIAYAFLRKAGFSKEDILIDAFCGSGEIPIEAAFYKTGFPVNHYRKDKFTFLKLKPFSGIDFDQFFKKIDAKATFSDKESIFGCSNTLNSIKSSQKNAKIAGVNKEIGFSKIAVEWIDTKFAKGFVDIIASQAPSYSQHIAKRETEKIYNELFYQSEFVLKDTGKIALLIRNEIPEEAYLKNGFVLESKGQIWSGQQEYLILIFTKKGK